ncbi:hypothetical protein DTO012A8_10242 [Penicillium roqueforti]|nr:hypothetical protein DTO012A8_10242 [Penicillium roqueforti]
MQTDRPHVVLEYDCLDDPQIPEDQPLLGSPFTHSETHSQHGLTIITCTASTPELNYGQCQCTILLKVAHSCWQDL